MPPERQWPTANWTAPKVVRSWRGLPPGYIITAHPEGHTAQQEGHEMTDKAEQQVKLAELRETKAFEDLLREVTQRCLEAEERMEKAVATHDAMSAAWDNLGQEHPQTMTRDEAQKALDETEEAAKLAENTMGKGILGTTGWLARQKGALEKKTTLGTTRLISTNIVALELFIFLFYLFLVFLFYQQFS